MYLPLLANVLSPKRPGTKTVYVAVAGSGVTAPYMK